MDDLQRGDWPVVRAGLRPGKEILDGPESGVPERRSVGPNQVGAETRMADARAHMWCGPGNTQTADLRRYVGRLLGKCESVDHRGWRL